MYHLSPPPYQRHRLEASRHRHELFGTDLRLSYRSTLAARPSFTLLLVFIIVVFLFSQRCDETERAGNSTSDRICPTRTDQSGPSDSPDCSVRSRTDSHSVDDANLHRQDRRLSSPRRQDGQRSRPCELRCARRRTRRRSHRAHRTAAAQGWHDVAGVAAFCIRGRSTLRRFNSTSLVCPFN